ncbi:MAG: M14 family metallocarboxypeptidase [Nitrospinae bacterium]|nr:M14 family metallocarboxypeptidase [Nitrospinota bacterium]
MSSHPGRVGDIGTVATNNGSYPVLKIVLGEGNPRKALITAGIHGDEPAGVEAVCAFVERKLYADIARAWELTLLPCVNPSGYELGTRENHEKLDLNRHFKSEPPPLEVGIVQSVFQSPFDLTLDLHEDVDSPGFYLYQKFEPGQETALGFKVVERVRETMPINSNSEIEGMPAEGGVIHRLSGPGEMEWWPMALYALSKGAKRCLTLETAARFPLATRVEAHLTAVRTAFQNIAV